MSQSLKPVRKFFEDRLKEVSKNFREHRAAFATANIGKTLHDQSFQIIPGRLTQDGKQISTLSLTVRTFFDGGREAQNALFNGYDQMLKFKSLCLDPVKIGNSDGFIAVRLDSIDPAPLAGNENAIVFETVFTVTGVFNAGEAQEL